MRAVPSVSAFLFSNACRTKHKSGNPPGPPDLGGMEAAAEKAGVGKWPRTHSHLPARSVVCSMGFKSSVFTRHRCSWEEVRTGGSSDHPSVRKWGRVLLKLYVPVPSAHPTPRVFVAKSHAHNDLDTPTTTWTPGHFFLVEIVFLKLRGSRIEPFEGATLSAVCMVRDSDVTATFASQWNKSPKMRLGFSMIHPYLLKQLIQPIWGQQILP